MLSSRLGVRDNPELATSSYLGALIPKPLLLSNRDKTTPENKRAQEDKSDKSDIDHVISVTSNK